MSQLAKLSIACCKLVEVPPGLGKVVSLRFLDLSFNDLTDLPEVRKGQGWGQSGGTCPYAITLRAANQCTAAAHNALHSCVWNLRPGLVVGSTSSRHLTIKFKKLFLDSVV
jgi:hypothetical protein